MGRQEGQRALARLGGFVLLEPLGRGSSSAVYRGVHAPTGTPVAIKVLRGGAHAGRLAQELHAIAGLDHPGIAALFDYGRVGDDEAGGVPLQPGAPWLAFEFVPGPTPDAVQLDWARLRAATLDVLGALAHAHARGVVHRDVKPRNIVCSDRGAKLLDFGLAGLMGRAPEAQEAGRAVGTPNFMAPEQALGRWRRLGPWTDLYGVGCTLWALLCGAAPFAGSGDVAAILQAQVNAEPPPFRPRVAVPPEVEDWLRRMLEKAPSARFGRAADAATALLTLGALTERHVPLEAPLPTPVEAPLRTLGVGLRLHGLRTQPLIGRGEEREQLWRALRAVIAEGPRALLIRGVAGQGKSRLARWLTEAADEVAVAESVRAWHEAEGGPGDGVGPALLRRWGGEGLQGDALAEHLRGIEAPRGPLPPGVARLAAACLPGTAQAPDTRLAVEVQLLEALAARQPVILVVDDLQWGEASLPLIERLLDGEAPILVLGTLQEEALAERRPDGLAELLARPRVDELALEPLDEAEGRSFCAALVGDNGRVAQVLAHRADGNPLFADQLLADWIQRGLIGAGSRGLAFVPGARRDLPDPLHGLWGARIARVAGGRADRTRALELAAVLGRRVVEAEWGAACARLGLDRLPGLVAELSRRRLAQPDGPDAWAFVHGMLRESVLRGAREAGRLEAAQRACAEGLTDLRGARPDGLLELRIARHWLRAGQPQEALAPLGTAIESLLLSRGVEAARQALILRRTAVRALGLGPASREVLRNRLWRSTLLRIGDDKTAAQAEAQAVLALAEAEGDGWAEAEACIELARICANVDDVAGLAWARRAVVGAVAAGDLRQEAMSRASVAARTLEADPEAALREIDRSIEAAARSGDVGLEVRARLDRVRLRVRLRRVDGLDDELNAVLAGARAQGMLRSEAEALIAISTRARLRGDLKEAEVAVLRSVALRPPGDRAGVFGQLNLGLIWLEAGRPREALDLSLSLLRRRSVYEEPFVLGAVYGIGLAGLAKGGGEAAWRASLAALQAVLDLGFTNSMDDFALMVRIAAEGAADSKRRRQAAALAAAFAARALEPA